MNLTLVRPSSSRQIFCWMPHAQKSPTANRNGRAGGENAFQADVHGVWWSQTGEGIMHQLLLWICALLFLLGLCLSLFFHCFTKRNLLAWLAVLILNPVIGYIIALFLSPADYIVYLYRSVVSVILMLGYFYYIRKNTPLKESISFTLFAASAFPIVDIIIFCLLLCLGVVRCWFIHYNI